MPAKKIAFFIMLICIMVAFSACSLNSKQESATNPASSGEQPTAPVQPGGEITTPVAQPAQNGQIPGATQTVTEAAVNDKTVQKNTKAAVNDVTNQIASEASKTDSKQSDTSISEDANQPQSQPQSEKKGENNADLPSKVYVFTSNSGCCEATRQKFEQHRNEVKLVESKYGNRVAFTWLDVGVGDVAYRKNLQQYASQFGITSIPSIVVVDANDKVLIKQTGPLNMDEIDRVFGGLS